MSKTLALVSLGLEVAPWLPDAPERRTRLIGELRERRGPAAWGYEFDVQTRWAFYPAGSPNVIVTAFVVEAIHAAVDDRERAELVNWLTGPMWTGEYFRYVPGNDTCIHNANLLAARTLHRLAPDREEVGRAVATTARALPGVGLWPYGEGAGLSWVDNFHTAYVLDALLDLAPTVDAAEKALLEAVGTYETTCFAGDGTPHYYAGGGGPIDVHNVATALATMARLAKRGLVSADAVQRVLQSALTLEQRPGEFAPTPRAIAYPRWNQGHMHRALAEVCT